MASSGKKKTTMAKRDRENRLRERREDKKAKKAARKLASQEPDAFLETEMNGPIGEDAFLEIEMDGPVGEAVAPVPDDTAEHHPA